MSIYRGSRSVMSPWGGGAVDDVLSAESERPIQNRAVHEALAELEERIPKKASDLENDQTFQTKAEILELIADGIAKIVANAPEDLDTLKELAEWIKGHGESAAAINSDISDLKKNKADKATTLQGYGITDAAPGSHVSDTAKHITADERIAWNGKANPSAIPTKLSQLFNDSSFLTQQEVLNLILQYGGEGGEAMRLGNQPVGRIVRFKVNNVIKEFVIVHQGLPGITYDVSCNGAWIMSRDFVANMAWASTASNVYENSGIVSYLNGSYYNSIESGIRSKIKRVKIPYMKDGGGGTFCNRENGFSTYIFLPCFHELNNPLTIGSLAASDLEGSPLEFFREKASYDVKQKTALYQGDQLSTWTRSLPTTAYKQYVGIITNAGANGYATLAANGTPTHGVRPFMIMDPSLVVGWDGMLSAAG